MPKPTAQHDDVIEAFRAANAAVQQAFREQMRILAVLEKERAHATGWMPARHGADGHPPVYCRVHQHYVEGGMAEDHTRAPALLVGQLRVVAPMAVAVLVTSGLLWWLGWARWPGLLVSGGAGFLACALTLVLTLRGPWRHRRRWLLRMAERCVADTKESEALARFYGRRSAYPATVEERIDLTLRLNGYWPRLLSRHDREWLAATTVLLALSDQ